MEDIGHYYKVLGIDLNATTQEIEQAYFDLTRVWHPDRFHNDERLRVKAEEKQKEINVAYAVIKDFLRQNQPSKEPTKDENRSSYPLGIGPQEIKKIDVPEKEKRISIAGWLVFINGIIWLACAFLYEGSIEFILTYGVGFGIGSIPFGQMPTFISEVAAAGMCFGRFLADSFIAVGIFWKPRFFGFAAILRAYLGLFMVFPFPSNSVTDTTWNSNERWAVVACQLLYAFSMHLLLKKKAKDNPWLPVILMAAAWAVSLAQIITKAFF